MANSRTEFLTSAQIASQFLMPFQKPQEALSQLVTEEC
jgi:hypothetical protein